MTSVTVEICPQMTMMTLVRQRLQLCVSVNDVDREKKNSCTQRKPSKMPEQTRKHGIAINMPKYDRWSIKQKGRNNSTKALGMSPSVCDHQGENTEEGFKIWMEAKVLEGFVAATIQSLASTSIFFLYAHWISDHTRKSPCYHWARKGWVMSTFNAA